MMKFGVREAMEMFELLRDSACMIDHYTDYINHCQDPQLKQILENQQRRMVENYHQKVSVIQGHGLDLTNIPRFQSAPPVQNTTGAGMTGLHSPAEMAGIYGNSNMQFGYQHPGMMHGQEQKLQSQSQSRALSDRTIAQGALLFHKCGATRDTTAALESAEPHLRNLAANSARVCMDMAYEVFQYMEQKGYYQMPEMPQNFVNHMQSGAQGLQGMQQGYQTGSHGTQGHLS